MPANRRKRPTRENEKGGGGESRGEKIRKGLLTFSRWGEGAGGRGRGRGTEVGRGG